MITQWCPEQDSSLQNSRSKRDTYASSVIGAAVLGFEPSKTRLQRPVCFQSHLTAIVWGEAEIRTQSLRFTVACATNNTIPTSEGQGCWWSGRSESNRRHPRSKRGTLPTELRPEMVGRGSVSDVIIKALNWLRVSESNRCRPKAPGYEPGEVSLLSNPLAGSLA